MFLGLLFDWEGFEEENLCWCLWMKIGVEVVVIFDLGMEDVRVIVEGVEVMMCCIDEGNILNVVYMVRCRVRRVEREGVDDVVGVDGWVRGCGGGWLLRMSVVNLDLVVGW